jgi:hypothetical protein
LGEYSLADETYQRLVEKLADGHFTDVAPALAANITEFFGDGAVLPGDRSRHHKDSAKLRHQLDAMVTSARSSAPKAAN